MQLNYHDLHEAFKSVKANHGCAGVDGVTIGAFESDIRHNLQKLEYELSSGSYFPLPLLKILVDKGKDDGEFRTLCIPAVRDRIAQTAVLNLIEPMLEKEFEDCSFAYRKGRSVKQAILTIKECYEQGYRWVVDSDIDAFFDNVSHELLLERFKRVIHDQKICALVAQWIAPEVWDGEKLFTLEKGIPQGSPVSPILANLFLDELDEVMLGSGYKFIRYADDFVVLCKNPKEAGDALELSKKVLDRLHLSLDEEDIVSFDQGFKYLGVMFIKSMIMVPFDRPKRKKRAVSWPKPFNLDLYMLKRKQGW